MKFLARIKPQKYMFWSIFIQVTMVLFASIIITKLLWLQVIKSAELKERASLNRQADRSFSFRGEIHDRNGIRLAGDTTIYDIYAHPQYYNKKQGIDKMANLLAQYLEEPPKKLEKKLSTNYSTITIAKNVNVDVVEKKIKPEILKQKIRGLDFVKKNKRIYPQGNLASHILGYINFDANLAAGVERTAQSELISIPDLRPIEYDGKGKVIYDFYTDPEKITSPLKGVEIQLTIDTAIQHAAEKELAKVIKETDAEKGTVIVMNPQNGEILGFAVQPSYDPNEYNKFRPSVIKNWALSDVYPPGSTFKILTIASALETGYITENEKIYDTGKIDLHGWTIKNHDYAKNPEPGFIDLEYLFEHSSNIGSLKVALKMPYDQHYSMLNLFGIGLKTGIDLPGESAGIIPELKNWNDITQGSIGYGYSIATTPIQIAAAVSAIANGGTWITPHVIKYKNENTDRIKKINILSNKTCKTITRLLANSIEKSDSSAGKIPHYRVAGKTGTSKKPKSDGQGYSSGVYASFIGYFPAKNPEVLIMVVIDEPKTENAWGSTVASPVFNAVAKEVARVLNLESDK